MRLPGKIRLQSRTASASRLLWMCFLTGVLAASAAYAQRIPPAQVRVPRLVVSDSTAVNFQADTPIAAGDTTALPADSLSATPDSNTVSATARLADSLGIRISRDALPAVVTATARDSAVVDMETDFFYLYGSATVQYEDLTLGAGRVEYEQRTGTITASPLRDTLGTEIEKPTFAQGEEKFVYDSLRYNFNSRRAIVRNARTQYGEGFVASEQVKRNPDQSIFGLRNVYTTCALDTPHFGIRARRIKVIPGRIAVSGSANLEIEGVPTPLQLPFALFPITQGQRSGFRLPSYTLEERRGLGLTNGGYYFYISDRVDLLLSGSVYSRGSWNASAVSTYVSRYKFSGGLQFAYGYERSGEVYERNSSEQRSFGIIWNHRTDPKARPGVNFSADVNINKGNFYQRNSYNPAQIVQNQYTSNVAFSRTWQDRPMSFTAAARVNQNIATGLVNLNFPDMAFQYSQITPFKRRVAIGPPKWYERITTNYTVEARNQTSFYDSSFQLSTLSLGDFRNGIKHSLPVSASYQVARVLNLNFNAPYTEYWLLEKEEFTYNEEKKALDTILRRGFFTARDFQASLTVSTNIYGTKLFPRGRLAGIRHKLEPSVGFGYTPDFASSSFRYAQLVQISENSPPQYVSRFSSSVIGLPGGGSFGNFASTINYGVNNNLQIKVRTRKVDTTTGQATRNVTLIDGFRINGSYNLSADSFNFSPLNVDFRTSVSNILSVSAGATFDPYGRDPASGQRVQQPLVARGEGVARFQSATASLSANFRAKDRVAGDSRAAARTDALSRVLRPGGYNDYIDFNIPWSLSIAYSLGVANNYSVTRRADTLQFGQQFLTFQGDFNLTPRWKVTYSSGYNIKDKALQLTRLDIYRDLHCWEMRLGTTPFGPFKSYDFTLNVKASVLHDLRLLRRRDFRDAPI